MRGVIVIKNIKIWIIITPFFLALIALGFEFTSRKELLYNSSLSLDSPVGAEKLISSQIPVSFQYQFEPNDSTSTKSFIIRFKKLIDFSSFSFISLSFSPNSYGHFILSLYSVEEQNRSNSIYNHRPFQKAFHLNKSENRISFSLSDLRTPNWWVLENGKIYSNSNFKEGMACIISSYGNYSPGAKSQITLTSLKLQKDTRPLWIFTFIFSLLVYSSPFLQYLYSHLRKGKSHSIYYKPQIETSTGKEETLRIMTIMEQEYEDVTLSLRHVGELAGVTPSRISKRLQKEHNKTFKQVLNHLRVDKVSTLLKESNLSIGILHLKCGYKTRTHFHRVFKELKGCSPKEYRENHHRKEVIE
jgi:AraC-like DNA-binding protein